MGTGTIGPGPAPRGGSRETLGLPYPRARQPRLRALLVQSAGLAGCPPNATGTRTRVRRSRRELRRFAIRVRRTLVARRAAVLIGPTCGGHTHGETLNARKPAARHS